MKNFFNHYSYSDVTPYEVVRVISEQTVEVRRMSYELLNKEELVFNVGGFCAHSPNQNVQKYSYSSDESAPVVRVRLNNKGVWKDAHGNKFSPSDEPRRFYDYNF